MSLKKMAATRQESHHQCDDIKEIAQAVLNASPKDNSTAVQRERVLKGLTMAGSHGVTTIQFREHLDVMSPAPRVLELRRDGINIQTIWDSSVNAQGKKHRNARYVLINSTPSSVRAV